LEDQKDMNTIKDTYIYDAFISYSHLNRDEAARI
jgi:hypothetical protein